MTRVLTPEGVAEQLRKYRGNMAAVGRAFRVTRSAVWQYVATRPDLVAVADECREAMKDEAESSLYKAVRGGEGWAVCFYLKTQAKDRGYVEKADREEEGAADAILRRILLRGLADDPPAPAPSANGHGGHG